MNKYISIIDMVILLDDDEFHGVCFAYGTYEHDHETSLPLMNSTWLPSFSRGMHKAAGVLGATFDTMIGIPWSAPP